MGWDAPSEHVVTEIDHQMAVGAQVVGQRRGGIGGNVGADRT